MVPKSEDPKQSQGLFHLSIVNSPMIQYLFCATFWGHGEQDPDPTLKDVPG